MFLHKLVITGRGTLAGHEDDDDDQGLEFQDTSDATHELQLMNAARRFPHHGIMHAAAAAEYGAGSTNSLAAFSLQPDTDFSGGQQQRIIHNFLRRPPAGVMQQQSDLELDHHLTTSLR